MFQNLQYEQLINWKNNNVFDWATYSVYMDWSATQQSNWECGTYVAVSCENRCAKRFMCLGDNTLVAFAKLRMLCKLVSG